MNKPTKHIDIEQVLASKSPRLKKALPRFMIRYLKKIVHEDEINRGLDVFGDKEGTEFIEGALEFLDITYTIEGLDNLDENERYAFVSNHPLGGLDGIILILALSKKFGPIKVPVNDLLMNVKQLNVFFIPVNKHGAQTRESAKLMESTYASDKQLFTFPAGLCSRKQRGGKIEDLEWKKNFIVKSIKHQRQIVPIFFSGKNSNFFYNLSRIRNFLGIKVNIEMLYLVDEMFKQKGNKLHARVGEPIPPEMFKSTSRPKEWTAWVKAKTYSLDNAQ